MLYVEDTFPCCLNAGTVRSPQEYPGDHLDHEGKNQRATPDVPPTSSAGDRLIERFVEQVAIAGSIVKPFEQSIHRWQFVLFCPLKRFRTSPKYRSGH